MKITPIILIGMLAGGVTACKKTPEAAKASEDNRKVAEAI